MSVCNTCALEKECMLKYDVSARVLCNSYVEKKFFTNADRIRAMTDEELANKFAGACPEECNVSVRCRKYFQRGGGCTDCWLDWLQQEVAD